MLVHFISAGEQFAELLRADRDHDRQTHRRPQRITAADPVPHLEHVFFRDAELDHFRGIGRHADEVLRQRIFRATLLDEPVAQQRALVMVSSVVNVLETMIASVSSGSIFCITL